MTIRSHKDLLVYHRAYGAAMQVFELSKRFPRDEVYSLTEQVRRSSRSVNMNLAEAWPKRRYPAAFISKHSDAETEAAETQTALEFVVACGYLDSAAANRLTDEYEQVLRMIVKMISEPDKWTISEQRAVD